MDRLDEIKKEIKSSADPIRAKASAWFFKTGKGEYGEGDEFAGLTVPMQRKIALRYKALPFSSLKKLLHSKIHEERLIAIFILVNKFKKGKDDERQAVFNFYLENIKRVNNWDLVDSSAGYIVGAYLIDKKRDILIDLAHSENLWERRISIIATSAFIYKGESEWTFKIAEILLSDKHDLIQKAVGWMLREVGKRCSRKIEEEFLVRNYKSMGRTALRYAIEHFEETRRKMYLLGSV